ncbi:PRC-barrel domain-containing protein [uncultured Amnibacterium sp.]|uniref:PRC-barrel domain-containing protein n=1 Tax=uncultured Amnibacterium sp. TaxID=1631851 RepID=UPI0035CBE369
MITNADADALVGVQVIDRNGDRLGTVAQVYLSEDGAQPLFVTVHAGRDGAQESFVPLQSADLRDGTLQVGYDRDTIAAAPELDADGSMTDDEQGTIFDYYDGSAGGEPSGTDGTPAGLADTPEERTVVVPEAGSDQQPDSRVETKTEGDDADQLGGESPVGRDDS